MPERSILRGSRIPGGTGQALQIIEDMIAEGSLSDIHYEWGNMTARVTLDGGPPDDPGQAWRSSGRITARLSLIDSQKEVLTLEAKESTRTRIGFSRMEKKYEWKDHVIFMGILLAMAVWSTEE